VNDDPNEKRETNPQDIETLAQRPSNGAYEAGIYKHEVSLTVGNFVDITQPYNKHQHASH